MARILTRDVPNYRVLHARLMGGQGQAAAGDADSGNTLPPPSDWGYGPDEPDIPTRSPVEVQDDSPRPADYESMMDDRTMLPVRLTERVAPGYHQAKLELNMPGLSTRGAHAWQWKRFLALDDLIRVVGSDGTCVFEGFVADVEPQWDNENASVIITANSYAFRLHRDQVVYGCMMADKDGNATLVSALRCHFNAGGHANRAPDTTQNGRAYIKYTDSDGNDGAKSCYMFTSDNMPKARYWTFPDAIEYLMAVYNAEERWVLNAVNLMALNGLKKTCDVNCEGMSLWQAIAAVCQAAGVDCFEEISGAADKPVHTIRFVRQHAGRQVTLNHQGLGQDQARPKLDLAETNLFSSRIAETVSGCVTRPIVAGGAQLIEMEFSLKPGWDPKDLATPDNVPPMDGWYSIPYFGELDAQFVQRYDLSGLQFAKFKDVGRKWVCNTGGEYSLAPYNLPLVNIHDDWPPMRHPLMPRIWSERPASPEIEVLCSLDSGAHWFAIEDFQVLPDEIGIWISAQSLTDIQNPMLKGINLLYTLVNTPNTVLINVSATIASPWRNMSFPARRATAGTRFSQVQFFDRGTLGQSREVAAIGGDLGKGRRIPPRPFGLGDQCPPMGLDWHAANIQDWSEDRWIEATLPLEWTDQDLRLTDCITKIGGIEYNLTTNAGTAQRSPRVVARTLDFVTCQMQVTLDTLRQLEIY